MDCESEDPPTSIIPAEEGSFSQVIFKSVPQCYPPNSDVKCEFRCIENFDSSGKHWIGIFKVGWKTTREYYTWISIRNSKDNTVTFTAYYLPKDDEYYQFCYVDHNGEVRGASIPFQFCHSIPEDEDVEDILMVTTEMEMMKKNEEIAELKKEIEMMKQENSLLKEKVCPLQSQNQAQDGRPHNLQDNLQGSTETIQRLETENMEITGLVKNVEDENERLKKTIQSMNTDLQMYREDEQKFLSDKKELEKSLEKFKAEVSYLQNEAITKQKEVENLTYTVNQCKEETEKRKAELHNEAMTKQKELEKLTCTVSQCKEETIKLKAELDLQTCVLEKEKKQKEILKQLLDKQLKKDLDLERNMEQKNEKLKFAEETVVALSKQIDSLKAEKENNIKQTGILHIAIAQLEGEVNRIKEEHKSENEKNMKQNEILHKTIAKLEGEVNRMKEERKMDAERAATELRTRLRSAGEDMHDLELKLAQQQDLSREQGEEILALKSALEIREEEIQDLKDIRTKNRIEIDELHSRLLGRSLSTSMSSDQSLIFGNPYEGHDTSFPRQAEAITRSPSGRPSSPLRCPVCGETFLPHEHQIMEDHVMCCVEDKASV